MTGKEIIKKWESLRLKAYLCPAKIWTIGWGHTKGVKEGDECTQEQADAWLDEDIQASIDAINKYVTSSLTGNQREALISFVFNVGIGNFLDSTLLRLINSGDYIGASNQFPRWNKARGVVLPGLTLRRKEEKDLFVS